MFKSILVRDELMSQADKRALINTLDSITLSSDVCMLASMSYDWPESKS